MKRKRASGAGRKPQGEFRGKTETLTTRITPATRGALERLARESGRSLSQEAEHRIKLSIPKDRGTDRGRHIRALGEAIMLVAQCIERATEKHWNRDAFAGEALRRGCEMLISHFAPRETPVTPEGSEKPASRKSIETRDAYRDAACIGVAEAGRVISWIESWNFRTLGEVHEASRAGGQFPIEWYAHEQLFRELGSGLEHVSAREKGS